MNTSVFILVPSTLISLLLFPLSFVHPSPSPADRVPICSPVDLLQGQHGRPLSAVTRQADLNVGEPLTVRLIYFHPRDREPQPFIDRHIDGLIRDAQQSYAEQLESHGFGRRTFRDETDATGKAVVHHVKGKFDDAYYHRSTFDKVIHTETAEQFDLSRNVYLVVLDVSTATIDGYCGQGAYLGPEGGAALVPAPNSDLLRERGWSCSNVAVTAHELGHVFGLAHDHFRNATRAPTSYDVDGMGRSSCAVEWLDGHRYFNVDRTYPDADEPTTIRMLPPLPIPPHSIRLRFEVTDSDGLHQAQLHNSTGEAVNCQGINGERARVEFVTPEVTEAPGNVVTLRVVDVYGNITEKRYPIDLTALLTPEVVSIPDANLAAVVRETLGLDTGDDVTQLDMLRLRHLEAPARQIRDLTGLEHAVNLKGLSLTENQIRDITPLAESTIMEVSDLHTNSISDLSPLARMNNLSYLNLNDNSVSDLSPLEGLTVLGNLELRANSVSDLTSLAGLADLKNLLLAGNSVSDLSPLARLTHLGLLEVASNPLSDRSINTYIPFFHSRGVRVWYENPRWALDFAHFANGASFTSDLVLVSLAGRPIRPTLHFFDKQGDPIAARSVVENTDGLVFRADGSLGVRSPVESLGELTISTHGRGKLVTGSVRVISDGPIGGVLRFDHPDIGVAGVGASQPVRDAIFPARRRLSGINTGTAIRNWGEEPIVVTCHLRQGGVVRDTARIELEGDGQESVFIHELFKETDTSNFTGSVHCTAPENEMFTGVALEMDQAARIFTTLPVVPLDPAVVGGPEPILHFAQFANGPSNTSDLVLVNVGTTEVRTAIHFSDPEGYPVEAGSVVDVADDLEVADGGALTLEKVIPPLGELTITTTGEGELKTGSVRVVADAPIGGVLRFDIQDIGVAGVGAGAPVTAAVFPARRQMNGINTGVAIHNLEAVAMTVTCILLQTGTKLAQENIDLEPNGQIARFIDQIFTQTDTSDFTGSVVCAALDGGTFAGVVLEMDDRKRIFTTLPIVPVAQ